MGKCNFEEFAELYTKVFSVLLMGLAAVVLGFGAYLYSAMGDTLNELELKSPALATVVFGAMLFVFSLCGLLGTLWENKFLLLLFVLGNIFITVGVLAAGVALLSYTNYLKDVKANDLQVGLEEKILAYELAVFFDCCDPNNPPPESCDTNGNRYPCYADQETYDDFVSFIGDTTCGLLGKVSWDGHPLVSKTDPDSCGGQNAETFVNNLSSFIENNMKSLAALNISISIIMLLLTVTSCYMLWDKDVKERKKPDGYPDDDASNSELAA